MKQLKCVSCGENAKRYSTKKIIRSPPICQSCLNIVNKYKLAWVKMKIKEI